VKLLQLTLMYPHPADTLPISSGGRLSWPGRYSG
jgi:hypothetical protein